MVTRNYSFVAGEFYHVYNRGTDKRIIYNDVSDYSRFIELLYLSNSSQYINVRDIKNIYNPIYDYKTEGPLVKIGAYCLMPNHFHILLSPKIDNGVGKFLNKLSTSYTMYFNHRYSRSGSLFQGPYKAKHVHSDRYLKYLFAYIHLNPVKLIQTDWKENGIANVDNAYNFVSQYRYSSLLDYLDQDREESKILSKETFPKYFCTAASHKSDLIEWLCYE